jgi:DNA-binding Lrp family transcriptional regulator
MTEKWVICDMDSKKDDGKIYKIDGTDLRILRHLRTQGRDSFRQVARKLQLHPATVIKRIEAMKKAGIITHFGASIDYFKLGYEFMALIEIRCTLGYIPQVGQKLAAQKNVVAVWDITGHEDMMALLACKSRAEFNAAIKQIGSLQHVERTITHFILNVVKSEYQFEL